jgi:RHS repeat-associated protein
MTDAAGGEVTRQRDARGFVDQVVDQLGRVTNYAWDDRGLMTEQVFPNGARAQYQNDAHGNKIGELSPDGTRWEARFDYWGRIVERTTPDGLSIQFGWTPAGRLAWVRERDGSVRSYRYDAMGNRTETTLGDGSVLRRHFGGLSWPYLDEYENGDHIRVSYNLDGQLVSLQNELGERSEWVQTPLGPVSLTMFDGRKLERSYDRNGRLIAFEQGHGRVELRYDAAGQLVGISFPDGSEETFAWDLRGEMTEAQGPSGHVLMTRNAIGDIVGERVDAFGEATSIAAETSSDGARRRLHTSWRYDIRIERDAMQRVARLTFGAGPSIGFERNEYGRSSRIRLPGGASIESEYDGLTRLVRRCVVRVRPDDLDPSQPVWIGPRKHDTYKAYRYNERGQVVGIESGDASIALRYDARDRLVARLVDDQPKERYQYDAAGNIYEPEGGREYGPGNRLLRSAHQIYEYDDAGFLVRRVARHDDGDREWQYEWTGQDTLAAVALPDGRRVEFAYDALERRIAKRLLDAEGRVENTTRFLWDVTRLIQERTSRLDVAGNAIATVTRSFVYEDDCFSPMAERVETLAGETVTDTGWLFYVCDLVGRPELLVDGDGVVVTRIESSAYGDSVVHGPVWTPVRAPGQFEDLETGLFYNYRRYYDPQTCRYISPDPVGIDGGWNAYPYCKNPIDEIDPFGTDGHDMFFGVFDADNQPVGPAAGFKNGAMPIGSGEDAQFKGAPWNSQSEGHTEPKALHILNQPENEAAKKAVTEGTGTVKMSGQFPPCKRCHKKMQKWAETNLKGPEAGKIDYHYPTNQKITYTGKGPPTGSASSGQPNKAQQLLTGDGTKKGYDNDQLVKTGQKGTFAEGTKKEGQEFDKKAWDSTSIYDDQKQEALAASKAKKPAGPAIVGWPPE